MGDISNSGYVSQSSNSAKLVRASTQFTNSQGRRRIDINASNTQFPCFYVRVWQDLTSSFLLLTIYCSTMCTLEKSSDSHYYDGCSFFGISYCREPWNSLYVTGLIWPYCRKVGDDPVRRPNSCVSQTALKSFDCPVPTIYLVTFSNVYI